MTADTLILTLVNGDRVRLYRPYAEAVLLERLEAFVRDRLHADLEPWAVEGLTLLGRPVVIVDPENR